MSIKQQSFEKHEAGNSAIGTINLISRQLLEVDNWRTLDAAKDADIFELEPAVIERVYVQHILDPEGFLEDLIYLDQAGIMRFDDSDEGRRNTLAVEILIRKTSTLFARTIETECMGGLELDRSRLSNSTKLIQGLSYESVRVNESHDRLQKTLGNTYKSIIEGVIEQYTKGEDLSQQARAFFKHNMQFAAWGTESPGVVTVIEMMLTEVMTQQDTTEMLITLITRANKYIDNLESMYNDLLKLQKNLLTPRQKGIPGHRRGKEKQITHVSEGLKKRAQSIGLKEQSFEEALQDTNFILRLNRATQFTESNDFLPFAQAIKRPLPWEIHFLFGSMMHIQLMLDINPTGQQIHDMTHDRTFIFARAAMDGSHTGMGNYILDLYSMMQKDHSQVYTPQAPYQSARDGIEAVITQGRLIDGYELPNARVRSEALAELGLMYISPDSFHKPKSEVWRRRLLIRRLKRQVEKRSTLSIPYAGILLNSKSTPELKKMSINRILIINASTATKNLSEGYLVKVFLRHEDMQNIPITYYLDPNGELTGTFEIKPGEIIPLARTVPKLGSEVLEEILWKGIASRRIEDDTLNPSESDRPGREIEERRMGASITALGPGKKRRKIQVQYSTKEGLRALHLYMDTILKDPSLVHYPLRDPRTMYDHLENLVVKNPDLQGLWVENETGVEIDSLLLKIVMYRTLNFRLGQIQTAESRDNLGRQYTIRRGYDQVIYPSEHEPDPLEITLRDV